MKHFLFFFLAFFVFPICSNAQTTSALRLSSIYYYFNYNEDVPAPLKSAETAWLPGGRATYGFLAGGNVAFYNNYAVEFTQAQTDYDGSTQEGKPLQLKSKHTFMLGEADLGLAIRQIGGSTFDLTPYSGIGYRYWQRDIGDADTRGMRENYSWWYVPVGVRTGWTMGESWSMGCDLSARLMFGGAITFDFGHKDPSINSPKADLGNEAGWKISVPVGFKLSSQFLLEMESWYEHSSIGASNEVLVTQNNTPILLFHEPSSGTHQAGVSVGIVWGM